MINENFIIQPLRRVFEEGKNQILESGWAAIFTHKKNVQAGGFFTTNCFSEEN